MSARTSGAVPSSNLAAKGKDGAFQLAREYSVEGDHVRYLSVECSGKKLRVLAWTGIAESMKCIGILEGSSEGRDFAVERSAYVNVLDSDPW